MPRLEVTLFSGPHCGLCDRAEAMVQIAKFPGLQLTKRDITGSLEWKKAYGLRIPVLRREDNGAELGWPFDEAQLATFLR